MNVDQKIERSKSKERIKFSEIGCINKTDELVKIESSDRITVEPVWTLKDDFEGGMYADYITEHPEYDGIYVRTELAKRLTQAANSLDKKYKLVVRAGHRPLEVQKRLLKECMQDYKDEHPSVSNAEALEHARTFVSDPDISFPPHCCAAAIDVDVLDVDKNELVDFGSPMNLDDDISYLHYDKITPEQRQNRLLLLATMLDAGFASTPFEWWHFSYGDQVWAWFYKEKDSLYGLIS